MARSSTDADRTLFEDSARLSEEAELDMQERLSKALGIASLEGSPLPATESYMKQEMRASQDNSRLVALAGATPCNVLYATVGLRLKSIPEAGREGHPFRAWLDLYADASVQEMAEHWVAVLNRWADAVSKPEQEKALEAFAVNMQCEVDFWEQVWRAV